MRASPVAHRVPPPSAGGRTAPQLPGTRAPALLVVASRVPLVQGQQLRPVVALVASFLTSTPAAWTSACLPAAAMRQVQDRLVTSLVAREAPPPAPSIKPHLQCQLWRCWASLQQRQAPTRTPAWLLTQKLRHSFNLQNFPGFFLPPSTAVTVLVSTLLVACRVTPRAKCQLLMRTSMMTMMKTSMVAWESA